jgi:serine/threonine protein kinase
MTWISDAAIERLRAEAEAPPQGTDRYDLRDEIGRGGMGVVYRAYDRALSRDVAVKVLAPTGDADAEARLRREAHILAALEHPGIVAIHDVGALADGRPFYVMALVRGEQLDRHVERVPSLAPRLRLFDRLCDVVAFAHDAGVIHRDLKPSNIMIGRFGEVLVLDWGIARAGAAGSAPDARQTADGTVLGTRGYMAPEQAAGSTAIDTTVDVFSLGALLRDLAGAASGRRRRALDAIVAKATAADPRARYPRAQDLAADVRAVVDGERVSAYAEPWFERAGRLAWTYRTPIALVTAYLLMRVALLLWSR